MNDATPPTAPAAPPPHGPRHVVVFSGHRVDVPGRTPPRFPAAKARPAGVAIARTLGELGIGASDLALTQGSSGGDLLFAEACLDRGARLRLMLPGPETAFIEESVRASQDGDQWLRRYEAVRAALDAPPQVLPDAEGLGHGARFASCNRWLIDAGLSHGPERARFLCLWDGGPSGGAGGTADFVAEVRRRGLPLVWLDARLL
jgi:hypothetical protein